MVVGKDAISRLSFTTAKRVVDEMVVALARCKRPKLMVFADVLLKRRKRAETTPPTFCGFESIAPEALAAVEGCAASGALPAWPLRRLAYSPPHC